MGALRLRKGTHPLVIGFELAMTMSRQGDTLGSRIPRMSHHPLPIGFEVAMAMSHQGDTLGALIPRMSHHHQPIGFEFAMTMSHQGDSFDGVLKSRIIRGIDVHQMFLHLRSPWRTSPAVKKPWVVVTANVPFPSGDWHALVRQWYSSRTVARRK